MNDATNTGKADSIKAAFQAIREAEVAELGGMKGQRLRTLKVRAERTIDHPILDHAILADGEHLDIVPADPGKWAIRSRRTGTFRPSYEPTTAEPLVYSTRQAAREALDGIAERQTPEVIRALRSEAAEAGDETMVSLCDAALSAARRGEQSSTPAWAAVRRTRLEALAAEAR